MPDGDERHQLDEQEREEWERRLRQLREWEEQERQEWERTLRRRPKRCPRCRSERVAYLLWGLPAGSDTLRELVDGGEVELAGCLIPAPPDAPASWVCRSCRHAWGLTAKERREGLAPVGPDQFDREDPLRTEPRREG